MKTRLVSLRFVFGVGLCVGLLWVSVALAAPGDIELVSDSDFDSYGASISGDGRFVAFETMLPQDNPQIYVFDRESGIETHIDEGGVISYYEYPKISADGQWLAYRKTQSGGGGSRIHLLAWQDTYEPEHIIELPVSVPGWYGTEDITISADGCRVGYSFAYEASEDVYIEDVYYYDCIEEESFLVSKAFSSDVRGNNDSGYASISGNGQIFAFSSYATNLVNTNPPTDGRRHVYLRDLEAGETNRIMLPPEWEAKDEGKTHAISLSADGCYAAFEYNYEVAGEKYYDVFLYDCNTQEAALISIFNGLPSGDSDKPSISADGRFITFSKIINGNEQIFIYDSETENIKLISNGLDGNPGDQFSYNSFISADGNFIAFESWATNLVAGDTNDAMDVFVYEVDLSTGYRIFLPLIVR
jgi:Tol biopolymer transport system component